MKNTQKNKKSNIWARLSKTCLSFALALVSLLLVACGGNTAATSGFDAHGKYRMSAPTVSFYSQTSANKTNEYTGSFLWPMEYYHNKNVSKDVVNSEAGFNFNYDQIGDDGMYGLNGYTANSTLDDIVDDDSNPLLIYPDYSVWVDGYIYQIHVYADLENLKLKTTGRNFNSSNYVEALDDLSDIFRFSYRIGSSGKWMDADNFCSAVYVNNKGDVITGAAGHQDNNVPGSAVDESTDRKFYLCFAPRLENGSTIRRLKVKALPNFDIYEDSAHVTGGSTRSLDYSNTSTQNINRGESLYSNQVTYNAYRMTFKTYSVNSSTMDFGTLEYDSTKFYFYSTQNTYSQSMGVDYLSTITGYFPEGRIIEVNRTFEVVNETPAVVSKRNNYAYQSWSVNAKPKNTLALENTFANVYLPDGVTTIAQAYNTYGNMFENYDGGYTSVFGLNDDESVFAVRQGITNFIQQLQTELIDQLWWKVFIKKLRVLKI